MDPHRSVRPQFSIAYELLTVIRTWKARSGCEWQGSTPKNVKLTLIKSFAKSD